MITHVSTILGATAGPGGKFTIKTCYTNPTVGPLTGGHAVGAAQHFCGYEWSFTVMGGALATYFNPETSYNTPSRLNFNLPAGATICITDVMTVADDAPVPTVFNLNMEINGVATPTELCIVKDLFQTFRGNGNTVQLMDCLLGRGPGLEKLIDYINKNQGVEGGSVLTDLLLDIPKLNAIVGAPIASTSIPAVAAGGTASGTATLLSGSPFTFKAAPGTTLMASGSELVIGASVSGWNRTLSSGGPDTCGSIISVNSAGRLVGIEEKGHISAISFGYNIFIGPQPASGQATYASLIGTSASVTLTDAYCGAMRARADYSPFTNFLENGVAVQSLIVSVSFAATSSQLGSINTRQQWTRTGLADPGFSISSHGQDYAEVNLVTAVSQTFSVTCSDAWTAQPQALVDARLEVIPQLAVSATSL